MDREFKIALSQEYYSDIVYLSQYDTDYNLVFTVMDKYANASGIDGFTAKFTGTRNDTLGFTFDSVAHGNTVAFEINTSLTAIAGTHKGEIVFYDTNGLYFGTANVQIIVEPAARPDGTIDADVERAQEIAEQVQEIVDNAAAAVSGEAEKWATGQIDGTDVPSTDPAYENNAKYYAEQAADAAASIGIDATLTQTGKAADAKKTGDEISALKEDLNAIQTATSEDVGKALKAKTVTNGKVTEWEFGEAGGGSPFDLPTATNLITILRNCVFTKDVSINIDNLAEALGINSGDDDDDDDMTFTYGQSIPKGNTARTLELTGMTIALTEIRLVVALHSDFAQGALCYVNAPNAGKPYLGVDNNGDFYYSNSGSYSGSFSATPSDLSDFVDTIKEVKILWLNPSGYESRKYLSEFKFFFNNYNPSCGYTLYRCSGFNGSTEVFRLESSGTNGELYDVLTGTTYTFNNTTGMEIVEVSE